VASLLDVRNNIYVNINRTSTATMDAVLTLAINSACELIGHTISSIYEEEFWYHTYVTGDATSKTENFALPSTVKLIRFMDLVDTTTAGEEVYYPLLQLSPDDLTDTNKVEGYRSGNIGYTTSSRDITGSGGIWSASTFSRGGLNSVGRSSRSGRPEIMARVGANLHVHPYISTDYVGWKLRGLLVMYPDVLSGDTDTNTITNKYPYALTHFASGILWASHFHDQQRAQAEFQLGGQFLSSIASDDQIKKLVNIQSRIIG